MAAPKPQMPKEEGLITRRNFLYFVGWGGFSLLLGGWVAAFARYLFPEILYEPPLSFKAGPPEDFKKGEVTTKLMKAHRVWVIHTDLKNSFPHRESSEPKDLPNFAEDGFYAVWGRCTHLGCTPMWDLPSNRFKCPCHGSNYTAEADVVAGPAPQPMWRPMISISADRQIVINLAKKENQPGVREKEPYFLPESKIPKQG